MATIQGSASSEPLTGTTGNDTINGAGGSDTIDGLAGTDTAAFSSSSINFQITELSGIVQVKALSTAIFPYQFTTTKLINTEKIQFTNLTRDLFLSANNIILNRNFQDIIGTAQNDTIDSNGWSTFINGGDGTDTAVFFGNRSDFNITQLSGAVRVTGLSTAPIEYRGDIAQLTNIEKIQFLDSITGLNGYNNLPTGSIFISDITPEQGQVLTASNTLADADGLGTITYQWKAGAINIGTGNTYTVTPNEIGKTITVTANYTDGLGTPESVSSIATAAVTSPPLLNAIDIFKSVLGADEKLLTGTEEAGMIRVMADFSKAAYHLDSYLTVPENNVINDPSSNADQTVSPGNLNAALTQIQQQGWKPIALSPVLPSAIVEVAGQTITNGMYDDGFYVNGNAAACVVQCGDAVVISFRGTNDNGGGDADTIHPDKDHWAEMYNHYALLEPLITAFDTYVSTNLNINKVYVTGHSMGGAMVIEYMSHHSGAKYEAVSFAAPPFTGSTTLGKPNRTEYSPDDRITQIEISGDPVPMAHEIGPNEARPGHVIRFAGDGTMDTPDLQVVPFLPDYYARTANHSMDYYRQITDSVDAVSWMRILAETGDQAVFLGGRPGVGDNFIVDGTSSGDNKYYDAGDNTLVDPTSTDYKVFYGGKGIDTLTGGEADEMMLGGIGKDVLNGMGGIDRLFGDAGKDNLDGGIGADTMVGGLGDDTYFVDNVGDVLTEKLLEGTDNVRSSVTYTLKANVDNLTLTGEFIIDSFLSHLRNDINGTGNDLANTIIGNIGNNILRGGGGVDQLFGKGGKDTLTGGSGADKFIFDTAPGTGNNDTITDFVSGTDKIILDDDIFTMLGITGTLAGVALTADKFHIGTSALDTLDRIVYNSSTGALYYDANGSVSGQNVQIALIGTSTHPTLAASDFLVIA